MKMTVIAMLALLLAGCATKQGDRRPLAWLKPGVQVSLPAADRLPAFSRQQLLSGVFKGKQQSLMVLLSSDGHQLSLVGLSPLGIRLFRMVYSARGIETEQTIALPEMPPASQVLADILLSRWPTDAWRGHLPPGWRLTDRGDERTLCDRQGNIIAAIHYRQHGTRREPAEIQNNAFGYRITIQDLDTP